MYRQVEAVHDPLPRIQLSTTIIGMRELVQLGTLTLSLASGEGVPTPSVGGAWIPLDLTLLSETQWAEDSIVAAGVLSEVLRDTPLGAVCERQSRSDTVVVRVSLPSHDGDDPFTITLHPARTKRLRALLHLLDKGWNGGGGKLVDPPTEDLDTGIQALYSLIEDPPEPSFGQPDFLGDEEVFAGLQEYENPPGIKTMLYKYQLRSVARMLQMETSPDTLVDPAYVKLLDPSGEAYYINQHMDIRRHPTKHTLNRGGILCEQMGVGKTLICLALVLVSKHQYTRPPVAHNASEPLTDVALRTYATPGAAAVREAMGMDIDPSSTGTPSLASLCADVVSRLCPTDINIPPGASHLLEERKTWMYYKFRALSRLPRAAKAFNTRPERYFLSATTLVVVPNILVPQWLAEAETHLETDALSLLLVKEGKDPLPPVQELMRHDIVLMSLERFRREATLRDEMGEFVLSELQGARWKRIILDEGNIANSTKSEAMMLVDKLSIERRWIVSGTPTTGLKQGTEGAFDSFIQSEGLETRRSHPPSTSKKWSKSDLEDVSRIGKMLGGFLADEVFSVSEFQRLVSRPLRNADGPTFGAVERIRQIMSAVMVKHRPGVIDKEVALPSSSLTAQKVRLTHLQRLTYNALTALVGSNVWTSQGEDEDYFLHSKNVALFNQVVANLHLACMWFSSCDMDVEGAYSRTLEYLKRDKDMTEVQRKGLQESVEHLRAAIETPAWAEWMHNGAASVPCEVPSLPAQILDSWSESPDNDPSLLEVHALRQLRDLNHRGAMMNDVAQLGWDERIKGPQAEALLKAMTRDMNRTEKMRLDQLSGQLPLHRQDTKAAAEKPRAPKVTKPKLKKQKDEIDIQLDEAATNSRLAEHLTSTVPRPLPSLLNITTASSKITYVVSTILAAPEDKFVMFGTYEEIGHVTEALDLAGISSVYVGAHVRPAIRKSNLKEFAKPNIRVCLLELNFAARGLTLTIANRMIFLAPVWSLDMQAQAIKRIHRIGQTRATHIDILVTEGTFEEDIVRRETSARSNEEEKRYSRALIENPRFVYAEAEDTTSFPVSMVPAGTASEVEMMELERELAASFSVPDLVTTSGTLTPLSSRATTPIITPGTPELRRRRVADADQTEDDMEVAPMKRRRVMFAE